MKYRAFLTALSGLCLAHAASAQTTATWTNASGGSWDTAGNWGGTLPTWGADLTVDFSTLNITANRSLSLNSTGKVVGKIIFGDSDPTHQWDVVAGAGPLTLSTTSPAKPVIEVVNQVSVITVGIDGTQGFDKTGAGTIRLNNTANAITGEILVSEGVLQIRDGSSNTPGVFAAATMDNRSLRVTGSGIVDLWRVNATGSQNVTWSLPAISLENAGTLRFRTNNGATYNHSMNASITAGTGGGLLLNAGGTAVQNITLSGALSGSGALEYLANSGTTRRLTVSSADNNYSGNWSVSHSDSGTAFLRADAANALGTGTVTLKARATLENNATGGINSLEGVKLTAVTSTLALGANPWNNVNATITAENGTILLGSGASALGTFTLNSPDTVTLDADTGGSLAATTFDIQQGTLTGTGSLTGDGGLIKSTTGTAALAGIHTYTGDTLVSAGTLLVSGSLGETDVTVAADATIGGTGSIAGALHLGLGSDFLFSMTDTLTVNGASVTFDGFSLANLSGFNAGVPDGTYTLIDGAATFDFTNVGNFGVEDAMALGDGRLAYFESGSLQLVVIPEPRAALLGGLGLLALLRRRR